MALGTRPTQPPSIIYESPHNLPQVLLEGPDPPGGWSDGDMIFPGPQFPYL